MFIRGDLIILRPKSKLTDAIIDQVRDHKPELLTILCSEPIDGDGCGPWQPRGNPRRCPRCKHGLQPSDADGATCFSCNVPVPWWANLERMRVM